MARPPLRRIPVARFLSASACALAGLGCSGSYADPPAAPPTLTDTNLPEPAPAPQPATPVDEAGPPPRGCEVGDSEEKGFFERTTPLGKYVGFVPRDYDGEPTRLVVGLHGCGDSALNFARWGINPESARKKQSYIGIAVDGASAKGGCWATADAAKVFAAIRDVSDCFYVHQRKIVLAGFSSGGILAYRLGMEHTSEFAGLLIENSTLSSAGRPEELLGKASWKIHVAHLAHKHDDVFPIDRVRADWGKLKAAGFPTDTEERDGGHDGSSEDWAEWILPKMSGWRAP